jgi:hypothetical protein
MNLDPQVQLKLIEMADAKAQRHTKSGGTEDAELNNYLEQFKKIYGELIKAIDTEPRKPHTNMSNRY